MFDALFEAIYPLFDWMQKSSLATAVSNSAWAGAAFNVVHLLSLVVLMGSVALIDLRLLGVGARDQPLSQVAAEAFPWLTAGLAGLFVTGGLQLVSLAERNYYNWNFWFKMTVLVVALSYTFTIWRKAIASDAICSQPLKAKLVGIVSLGLWIAVAIPGRLIGLT